MRRADLERLLDQVPDHPAPDPDLEQYRTPAAVAADLLLDARDAGDVAGRRVLDLGCGTGVLAIGAAALGAGHVLGVDVDAASVGLAQSAAARLVPRRSVAFEAADVAQWRPVPGEAPFDTVVMNPPFGAQRANRRADRVFYERALAAAPGGAVWFLAPHVSERFLSAFAAERGMRLERTRSWAYPLPARFGFHREAVRTMAVGGYCLRGVGA